MISQIKINKIIFSIIIMIFCLSSCEEQINNNNPKIDIKEKIFYRAGTDIVESRGFYIEGDTTFFKFLDYYSNGVKRSEINYMHGETHGLNYLWYENGNIKYISEFILGMQDGLEVSYDSLGFPTIFSLYDNGKKITSFSYKEWIQGSYQIPTYIDKSRFNIFKGFLEQESTHTEFGDGSKDERE